MRALAIGTLLTLFAASVNAESNTHLPAEYGKLSRTFHALTAEMHASSRCSVLLFAGPSLSFSRPDFPVFLFKCINEDNVVDAHYASPNACFRNNAESERLTEVPCGEQVASAWAAPTYSSAGATFAASAE
jgi:hypothetical protein